MALLPKMRRQNKNADTVTYGIRGFPAILSKVQIHLRDSFQRRKNSRNLNAGRLDAVQTEKIDLYCVYCFYRLNKNYEEIYYEKQRIGRN